MGLVFTGRAHGVTRAQQVATTDGDVAAVGSGIEAIVESDVAIGGENVGEENLLNFLMSETFHSDDFSFRKHWNDEDLKFTFKLNNVWVVKHREDREINADVDILDGFINLTNYNDIEDNYGQVRYDISRNNNEIDDMSTYFDVMDDLKVIIQSFIIDMAIKYGTEFTDAEVEILN